MLGTAGTLVGLLALAGPSSPGVSARRVLEEERCQTELPLAGGTQPGSSRRLPGGRLAEAEPGVVPPPITIPLPSASVLTVVVLAIAVASALAFLVHRLPGRSELEPPEPVTRPARPPAARARPRDDPQRLAAEGRFAEAIHALLLQALGALGEPVARPALTSREVLRGSRLGQEARAALAALVSAVERAHFGGKPAGASDYEASLAAYRRLRSAWPART